MFGKVTGFMSNDQVATDTAALQNYISQMKALKDDAERAAQKQNLINSFIVVITSCSNEIDCIFPIIYRYACITHTLSPYLSQYNIQLLLQFWKFDLKQSRKYVRIYTDWT